MTARRPPRRASQEGMGKRPVRPRARASKEFVVNEKWTPPRRPTTVELGTARKTFYELDRDGTGAIVSPSRSRTPLVLAPVGLALLDPLPKFVNRTLGPIHPRRTRTSCA